MKAPMTLAQIVERLERIERMPLTLWREYKDVSNEALKDELRALKLEIEIFLIREGKL